MRKLLVYGVLFALCLAPARVRAEEQTLESVEGKIGDEWSKVKSYSAKMGMEALIPMGPVSVTTTATGGVEYLVVGEKPRFRMEMVNKLGGNIPLTRGGMEQKVLTVYNGEAVFSEVEMMGMKKYMKSTPKQDDARNPSGGKSLIEAWRKKGEVKLLPDETVNGVDTYVFEVKPNAEALQEDPVKPDKIRFCLAKNSGIQVRMQMFDATGTAIMTMNYSDIKVNPELDPKRFDYAPPPGAEVVDMGSGGFPKKSPF